MNTEKQRMPSYGGQALLEGVLMRGKNSLAAAVRLPNGEITIQSEKLQGIYINSFFTLPFIRGLVILWDSLIMGMKYLTLSANLQGNENEKIDGPMITIAVVISLVFSIFIFFLVPAIITSFISRYLFISSIILNLIEGIIRLILLLLYLWLISYMKDINRLFAYHGAEHKTINAYENHAKIDVDTVMKYSVEHPRCGTSFILTIIILSIICFSFFGNLPILLKLLARIIAIPILAMLSYEIIRWISLHLDNPIIRILVIPNMALQKMTTREPSPDMVEVSIAAFKSLLTSEQE